MNIGVLSYYGTNKLNKKSNKEQGVIENSFNSWASFIKEAENNFLYFDDYNQKKHNDFDQILIIEIPRIWELFSILLNNLTKKKLRRVLVVSETNLSRNRLLLNIPFLFDLICVNTEEKNYKFLFYKTKTFHYASLPDPNDIAKNKNIILNSKRKNKICFISSFKIAFNRNSTYLYRYRLIKSLCKFPNAFEMYGYGWDKSQIPIDIPLKAIIRRIPSLRLIILFLSNLFFKPIDKKKSVISKFNTLKNFDFSLTMDPFLGRPYAIFEKIFDPMLSGSIPIYLGPKNLKNIPNNCYIRISRNENAYSIIENTINSLTLKEKEEYRKRIYKFLLSKKADKYRHSYHNKFLIKVLIFNE